MKTDEIPVSFKFVVRELGMLFMEEQNSFSSVETAIE